MTTSQPKYDNCLYYIHDPMCSWCYAFRHSLAEIKAQLPKQLPLKKIVGGLAPDNEQAMDEQTQVFIQEHWRKIESSVRDTQFNFDFWSKNTPRRSTYPACRAILAAKSQGSEFEDLMIKAIQHAYYQLAINPSLDENLVQLAAQIGLDKSRFQEQLNSDEINAQLNQDLTFCRQIGVRSFPSLVLFSQNTYHNLRIDYNNTQELVDLIQHYA